MKSAPIKNLQYKTLNTRVLDASWFVSTEQLKYIPEKYYLHGDIEVILWDGVDVCKCYLKDMCSGFIGKGVTWVLVAEDCKEYLAHIDTFKEAITFNK